MSKRSDSADVAELLGQLLLRANRAHLYGELIGSERGVQTATYPVLSGLARLGTTTATELADQIGLDRTVTTRHASRLEEAGLVERLPHPTDARATCLRLTARGRRSVAAMRDRLEALIGSAMTHWSAAESRTFARQFQDLADAILHSPADRPASRSPQRP